MSYDTVVMRFLTLFMFSFVLLEINGDVCYKPKITDRVVSCDDFNNEFLDCDDLHLGSSAGDDGDDSAKLNGNIKFMMDILPDYDLEIDVWKVLPLANEYMYNSRINFCSSLDKKDAPWTPVVEKLNISSCPVPVSDFCVQGLTISLDFMKDVLNHDLCGEYRVELSFMDVADKISCHVIELSIVEEEEDCE